jgi:hypothetical protein
MTVVAKSSLNGVAANSVRFLSQALLQSFQKSKVIPAGCQFGAAHDITNDLIDMPCLHSLRILQQRIKSELAVFGGNTAIDQR